MSIEIKAPTDSAADPAHPRHARWVKATLVEDDCRRLYEAGIAPDTRAIEREWTESLERVAARERDTPVRRKAAEAGRRKRADKLASELGYLYQRERAVTRFEASQRCRLGCGGACARCRLEGRVRALCASEGAGKNRRFLFPEGREIVDELGHCLMRRGPYANVKTDAEANRILHRALERIADRSIGRLGGWR